MASVFTKIVNGEIPSFKVAESDKFYAFLDINPVSIGHTLVIPKAEIDYIFDIDDVQLGEMMLFAKKVARALKMVVPCNRVGVAVIGLEVPHAHIHLVPINSMDDINFSRPKLKVPKEQLEQLAIQLRAQLEIN